MLDRWEWEHQLMVRKQSPSGAPPVAVSHTVPAYRRGLEDALRRADYLVEQPRSPRAWAEKPGQRVLILDCPDAHAVKFGAALNQLNEELTIVALVDQSRDGHREALEAGLYPVMAEEEPTQLVAAIRAATTGHVYVGKEMAQSLAHSPTPTPPTIQLSQEERAWLTRLAEGWSVKQIADEEGLSRRELFRRLKHLYKQLGATNKPQALVIAAQMGLIEPQ